MGLINANISSGTDGSIVATIHEKWVVEVWDVSKVRSAGKWNIGPKRLTDILEITFDTEPLAAMEAARRKDEQIADNQKLLDDYANRMEDFVIDLTTDDREPIESMYYTCTYHPVKYLLTMNPNGTYNTLIYKF